MKKIFALMLALCLMLGCTALAEEPTELNWEGDYVAAAENIGGQWLSIDALGLVLWAPNDFIVVNEIPEEFASDDVQGMFVSVDEESGAITGAIIFQYIEASGADVMDCVNAINGAEGAQPMVINGFPCVNFDLPAKDATCVAFGTEQGNLFVVSFLPLSNADFGAKATIMMASLQSAE